MTYFMRIAEKQDEQISIWVRLSVIITSVQVNYAVQKQKRGIILSGCMATSYNVTDMLYEASKTA